MQNISVIDLKQKLTNNEDITLIDVRNPDEHQEYNIGGILAPLPTLQQFQLDSVMPYKDKTVVCYCRSGVRSVNASLILEQAGFKNVINLEGGMNAWKKEFEK